MNQVQLTFDVLHSTTPFPDECHPILNSIKRKLRLAISSTSCLYWLDSIIKDGEKIAAIFKNKPGQWPEWNNFAVLFSERYVQEVKNTICAICGKKGGDIQVCGICHEAYYCSANCQKKDWPKHHSVC